MKVGFGLLGVLLGLQPHAAAEQPRASARSRIALSSVCMTSRITVRRDHLNGQTAPQQVDRVAQRLRRSHAAAGSGAVPSPVSSVNRPAHRVAARGRR